MLDLIQHTMISLGYPGIALLMFFENLFPPILIMPLAGFTTAQGQLSFIGVVMAGAVGSLLGQLPLYYLGRWVGKEKLIAWADRYGTWLMLSGHEVVRAETWFNRHGHKAVFLGRLVPGPRAFISIPAGISGMKMVTFMLYSALGIGLWVMMLTLLGLLLGHNYRAVDRYLGPAGFLVLCALLVALIIWLWGRRGRQRADDE